MTANEATIIKFYTALSNSDFSQLCKCYHPNCQFFDPVYGFVKGDEVIQIWKMLVERGNGSINIEFSEVKANEHLGSAFLIAKYNFSDTNRKVVNTISAKFQFKDGLIIKHTDDFNIWNWSKQTMGTKGLLLGWTGYMQKKIQKKARINLKKFSETK